MEKVTIARLGQTKDVNTKFGMKKKTGAQFKEYGEVWHDIWSGDLKEGQVLEGTRESREYQGKLYWSFVFPKKSFAPTASPEIGEKLERILAGITKLSLKVDQIYLEMDKKPRDMKAEYAPFLDNETYIPDPSVMPFEDKKEPEEPNFDEVPF